MYTIWGNTTVILSTILWIGLEVVYPFSVPFCLVVYLSLMVIIFLLSFKRNEFKDLWPGFFIKEGSLVDESALS